MDLRHRMLDLIDQLDEAKFAQRSVKLPKYGVPESAYKHFKVAGEQQKTLMRVARRAKEMGRSDAAALAVKKAREVGQELAGHREASAQRYHAAMAKKHALYKLRRKGSEVRTKIGKTIQKIKKRKAA